MRYACLAVLSLVFAMSCSIPGSQTPSASSPPSVLLSNYNGSFSYTVDAGSTAKNVYFVFSNTGVDASASAATVKNAVGSIKVDGAEIAASSAQPAGGPSASSTNIKDFLARSNRDIASVQRNGEIKVSANSQAGVGAPSFDAVGGLLSLNDIDASGSLTPLSAHCRYSTVPMLGSPIVTAQGNRSLNIYVADDCWSISQTGIASADEIAQAINPSSPAKMHVITQAMVDALAARFLSNGTTDIYAYDTAILGPEWGPLGSSALASSLIPFYGNITILLSDISTDNSDDGGIVGYFWDGNNYVHTATNGSNGRIMFVIDAVMYANPRVDGHTQPTGGFGWAATNYWAEEVFSTLAHEFQHMIQFYQKGIVKRGDGQTADTWINEMCSQLIEDLVASPNLLGGRGPRGVNTATGDAGPTGNIYGRIPDFNRLLSNQLTKTYSYGVDDYSFSYAFGSWLMRNYGGAEFVKNVVYDSATDAACITDAVTKATGRSVTLADLLTRWAVSVLGSNRTDMPPGYVYNNGASWLSSTAGGISYQLGSIDFFNYNPTPQVLTGTGSVPRGTIATAANVYFQAASGLTGSKTWSLDVPQGVAFSVVVTP